MKQVFLLASSASPSLRKSTPPTVYILGPGDQITVFVADLPDKFADKTFRVNSTGDLSLPVIGHIHVA